MTQKEFLKRLGLTKDELDVLLKEFSHLQKKLNAAQLDAVTRSYPTMARITKSFGPDMTNAELTELLREVGALDGGNIYGRGDFIATPTPTPPDQRPKPTKPKRPTATK